MKALRGCPYVLALRAVAFSGPAGAEDEAFMLLDLCKESLVSFLQARQFRLDDYTVLRVFLPVCRAVAAMHALDPPLAHRCGGALPALPCQTSKGCWQGGV